MIVQDNTPSVGYISWSNVKIAYKGQVYNIADGYTNLPFVYWKYSDPNYFYASNSYPTWLTDDDLLVFLNKNGIHLTVPNTTIIDGSLIVPESILTNALAANAVTAEKIAAGAITASKIAADAVGAQAIAAGAVLAEHINVDSLSAISANLGTVTAGEMTGVVIKTSPTADTEGIVLSGTQLKSNSAASGSNLTIDNGSVKVDNINNYHSEVKADAINFGRSTTSDASIFYYEPADGSFGELTIRSRDYITMNAKEIRTPNTERGFCGVGGVTTGITGPVAGVGVNFRTKKTYTPSSISLSGTSHNLIYSTHLHAIDISPDGFWLYIDGGDTNNAYRYWRGYYTA
ncbi:hypothetical protein [Saccharococcus caldoxylosilyticus]|uniref:Uncharacterized protein n=1 Tax=Saccharococcus caldoxylosilyticus TaxID=81408 RepID=A0A150LCE7_9BACL|nr:hypothetical protein [Parageobacillus caldoxylosilyticus]KYD09646.1 hypothetical protein B4119_2494 [Parageobacillus caldoxylosilyticus]